MNATFCSMCKPSFWLLLATLFTISFGASSAQANSAVIDSEGFENYSLGDLVGQSEVLTSTDWVTTGGSAGSATVQSTIVKDGSNALEVFRGGNSADYWTVRTSSFSNPNRYMFIDWDMRVTPTGATDAVGPFFGIETYDDTLGFNRHASLGVDATTGEVLYQGENEGDLIAAGVSATEDAWHNYRIRLDFQEETYQIFFDGTAVFAPGDEQGFINPAVSGFTDADIVAFAADGEGPSQGLPGTAYFDNYVVREVSAADLNVDGFVEGIDLGILLGNFNSPAPPSGGELSGFDPVDGLDLGILLGEWCPPSFGPLSAHHVPEPTSGMLLLLGLFGAAKVRRR